MVKKSAKPLPTRQRQKWLLILQQSAASKSPGEKLSLSIVLDSNIWISAIIHGGAAEAALLYGIGNATIVASDGIVAEVFDYFRHHTKAPYRWVRRMRQEFNRLCLVVAVKASHEFAVRDAKDAHVIAAAVEAQCDLIVTGDKDLLALGAYDGIKIITPVELIEQTG